MTTDQKDKILEALKTCWLAFPEQRLCQLLVNMTGSTDIFYVKDEDLLDKLNYFNVITGADFKSKTP